MEGFAISRRTVLRSVGVATGATALTGQAASDRTDGEYIVGIRPNRGRGDVRAAATEVRRELEFGDIGTAVAGRFPERALDGLRNNPNVRYVERDVDVQAAGGTTPFSATQSSQEMPYGIEQVNADVAHDAGVSGDGVHVAVLDTGIDSTHETLVENLGEGASFVECTEGCDRWWSDGNENTCTEDWDDDDDHGTHVAGTIGAADDGTGVVGVAPDSTLHAVKVLDCAGDGSLSTLAAGIEYVVEQDWDVANLSLGSTTDSQTLEDACRYAAENGVVLVAAAGSTGPCTDCVHYPAAYESAVAVTATDENDEFVSTSRTGPEVDLAAPGADILSSVPDTDEYEYEEGSSMACPHVAGAVALLLAEGHSVTETRKRLLDSAVDVGLEETEQGHGRLEVAGALDIDDDETDGGSDDESDVDGGTEDDDGGDDGDGESDGSDGGDEAPTDTPVPVIDQFDVADRSNPQWSRYDIEWAVSSSAGALESITIELRDGSSVVDSAETTTSDGDESGSDSLETRGDADTVAILAVDDSGEEVIETKDV